MLIDNWNELLWKFVKESYVPNQPLYIAVDQVTIQKLFNQEFGTDLTGDECELDFINACNSNIILNGNKAVLLEHIFTPNESNKTLCLSYAVQQVLAAEHMLSDEMYTANSFFPRYRAMIGIEDGSCQIPINYTQFERIWKVLESEILYLPDANYKTITFKQGSGINKNRALPMSQALLSYHNLNSILTILGDISSFSDNMLILQLRRKSNYFPKQVDSKIHNTHIIKQIISQIRSYSENKRHKETITRKKNTNSEFTKAESFEVYVDTEGWDEHYVLTMKNPEEYDQLEGNLFKFESIEKYLFLYQGIAGEYCGCNLPIKLAPKDKYLIVLKEDNLPFLKRTLRLFSIDNDHKIYHETNAILPSGYSMIWYEPNVLEGEEVTIGKTGLLSATQKRLEKISLKGGLLLNKKNREYLIGYPPDSTWFEDSRLSSETEILVDKEIMTVGSFIKKMRECQIASQISIEYLNFKIKIRLLSAREIEPPNIGFKIDDNVLSISPELKCSEHDSYFRNWSFYNYKPLKKNIPFPKTNLLFNKKEFLMDTSTWIHLSKEQISNCLNSIQNSCSDRIFTFIKGQILRERSVPPPLYKRLCRVGKTLTFREEKYDRDTNG